MFKKTLSVFVGVVAFVDEAVVVGLARTYPPAKCAALIFTVAFLSLHIEPDQPVDLQSTTSAVGVIGTLPVPALLVLFGRWNWWLPDRLDHLIPS
jgi:putative drug exporter of the RND superfamily